MRLNVGRVLFVIAATLASGLMLPARLAASPESQPDEQFPTGRIISNIACKSDPDYHYWLYLPSDYTPEKKWPILYTHSPGGGGYREMHAVCEQLGFICVGLVESKNGPWVNILKNQAAVWRDRNLLSIEPRRSYAFGFSGGARASFAFAFQFPREFDGVISSGADYGGLPSNLATVRPEWARGIAAYFITGDTDGNRRQIEQRAAAWRQMGGRMVLEIHPGVGHSSCLPDGPVRALRWLEMQWWRNNKVSPERVERVFDGWAKAVEAVAAKSEPWKLFRELEQFVPAFAKVRLVEAQQTRYDELSKQFKELAASEQIKKELLAKQRYDKVCLTWADAQLAGGNNRKLGMDQAMRELGRIATQFEDTEYGQRAKQQVERAGK